jgi:hypothetical protein
LAINLFSTDTLVSIPLLGKIAMSNSLAVGCFIRIAFMDSWINILPPDKMEPIFESVETRLNEQARQAGGFKLSIPFVLINAVKK